MALSLKAASVTTKAGSRTKPKMASTTRVPAMLKARWRERDMSGGAELFERPCGEAHETECGQGEGQARDRQARRKREIEARKTQLIDEIGDHVHLPASNQLRGREGAEGPGERRRDAGDHARHGERQGHGAEGANGAGPQ